MGLKALGRANWALCLVLGCSCPPAEPQSDTIVAAPTIISLKISPSAATLPPGGTQQFIATAWTSDGEALSVTVTFDGTGGTLTSSGLYTAGNTSGTFQVTATAIGSGLSDAATVTVLPTSTDDQVKLNHADWVGTAPIPVGVETVLLLDATPLAGSCIRDGKYAGPFLFGNLGGTAPCTRDEIAVFSVDDPFVLDTSDAGPGGIWTTATGEIRTEDLRSESGVDGPRVVKLALWYLTRDSGGQCRAVDVSDVDKASQLYNANRVGIVFDYGAPQPACDDLTLKPQGYLGAYDCPGTGLHPSHFTGGIINVYYVPALAPYVRGIYCSGSDPNVILISEGDYSETTLAHELGHAFGLTHTYDALGDVGGEWFTPGAFTSDNLMWSDYVVRTSFSLGQAFRINMEQISMLNLDQIRKGPTRQCECHWALGSCNLATFRIKADQDGVCPRISASWQ